MSTAFFPGLPLQVFEAVSTLRKIVTKVFSGAISDWFGRRKLLAVLGYGLGALTKPVFALAVTPFETPEAARNGLRLFNLASGAALFLASLLAGFLWQRFGSAATFLCGAALAGVALAGLLTWRDAMKP